MIKRKIKRPQKINKAVYGYGFDDTLDRHLSMTPRTSSRGPKKPDNVPILPLYQIGKTAITKPKPVDISLKTKLDKSPRPNYHDELVRLERLSQTSFRTSRSNI